MNRTNAISQLTEFLHSGEAYALLTSAECNIEAAEDARGGATWIESLIRNSAPTNSVGDIFAEVEEIIDFVNGAAVDLQDFVSRAHHAVGHVSAAKDAMEAFCTNPTEENRLKLVEAAKPMADSSVPMPASEKRKLRPFVKARNWRSKISYGSLSWIAETALDPSMIICAEAT